MTLRTFSSILPFTRRFGVRGVTCMTNGARLSGGGAGSGMSIRETALAVLQDLPAGETIRATDWVNETVKRGKREGVEFNLNSVWSKVAEIKNEHERHGVEWIRGLGYRMTEQSAEQPIEREAVPAERISEVARDILNEQGGGVIKLADWIARTMRRIELDAPDLELTRKRVHAIIYARFVATEEVERVARGMYRKAEDSSIGAGGGGDNGEGQGGGGPDDDDDSSGEGSLYGPFAVYLRDDLLECDAAKDVSRIRFGLRFENPDVMGLSIEGEGDSVPYVELVAAEIKADSNIGALLRGFGQACAYTRFAHKVYLVIPTGTSQESRLTDLCHKFGVGLVTADIDADSGQFTLLTRARKQCPIVSELNRYLRKLRENGGGARVGRLAEFGFKEDEE